MKKENGKYYAIVNVVTEVEELKKTGENIGIDLGLKTLVTLSNTQEIANLDLSQEETMIKKYQKKMSRKKYMSKNYQKTLKKYHKWVDRKNNKIKKYIPPHKQKNRRKLRHHINGGFKHQRNVQKQKMVT